MLSSVCQPLSCCDCPSSRPDFLTASPLPPINLHCHFKASLVLQSPFFDLQAVLFLLLYYHNLHIQPTTCNVIIKPLSCYFFFLLIHTQHLQRHYKRNVIMCTLSFNGQTNATATATVLQCHSCIWRSDASNSSPTLSVFPPSFPLRDWHWGGRCHFHRWNDGEREAKGRESRA